MDNTNTPPPERPPVKRKNGDGNGGSVGDDAGNRRLEDRDESRKKRRAEEHPGRAAKTLDKKIAALYERLDSLKATVASLLNPDVRSPGFKTVERAAQALSVDYETALAAKNGLRDSAMKAQIRKGRELGEKLIKTGLDPDKIEAALESLKNGDSIEGTLKILLTDISGKTKLRRDQTGEKLERND